MKIALFGDMHGFWDEFDVRSVNDSDYDYIFFTGDLKGFLPRDEKRIPKKVSEIKKKAFLIPGNWDSANLTQLVGEIRQNRHLIRLGAFGQGSRFNYFERALGAVVVTGYSAHKLGTADDDICLISGRPFSMGGNLSFCKFLNEKYHISTMFESEKKLKEIIDGVKETRLIFLAHNGPSGLGLKRSDIYGCDFRKEGGDWGDVDLRNAIDYAVSKKKKVLGVFSGHMHLKISKTEAREWKVTKDNILFVNAAKVPRIFKEDTKILHHHVQIQINKNEISANEVLLEKIIKK